jgi:putative oxidoreductase
MGFLDKHASLILGVTRIVAGLLFLEHGSQKLLGFPPGMSPHMFSLFWCAGVIELVGGALITLGLFSRCAAFVASGEMAFAYFLAHFPKSPFPAVNGGDAAILFCFIFLYLAAAGPGALAITRK